MHDTRTALDARFSVIAGPVAGRWPQPSADGLSHLTLITCSGTFKNGTHDHRLVVYATRTA